MSYDFDVLVIGGGVHGAGCAQAAAAAGHSVLILEQYPNLAQGSSSRSSKLIHGGLRYLETAQFGLVRESLREREILLRIAPSLVKLLPFHVPVYEESSRPPWKVRLGLSLYAALGGLHENNRFSTLPRTQWGLLDGLLTDKLRAVYRYFDAQTDDAALTKAVMDSAISFGASLRTSTPFKQAQLERDGVLIRFMDADVEHEVRARTLINASGPWAGSLLSKVENGGESLPMDLVQGTHLVLPGNLDRGIYYVEAPDGRAVFAMPWRGNILVGSTETPWSSDPAATFPLDAEIEYLLAAFARIFPNKAAGRRDIVAAFAGLRVLPRADSSAFRRPREVILHREGSPLPRLVSIYGGKLTTYRAAAERTLAILAPALPRRTRMANTATIEIA